ncbi:MAG TPA: SRPBCC family protein [Noviherbaspirillum sp.]
MSEYRLVATWRIVAPQQQVFDTICDSLNWPQWWPGAESVVQKVQGDERGIGSVRHYTWKGRLPYCLAFDARTTRVLAPTLLEAEVSGDLAGTGCWSFSHADGITTVHYEWHVRTTRRWMNIAALLVRQAFIRNHHALMRRGAEGLARRLGARLAGDEHGELPVSPVQQSVDWFAAAGAGVIAGVLATAMQMTLWWAAAYPVATMLFRDSRLAAAIILGPDILPAQPGIDWTVMLIATVVHFVLSIAYGLTMAPLTAQFPRVFAILLGGFLGLVLYGVNMYGLTALFPWFAASRDWITAVTHVAFGITVAASYRLWHALPIRRFQNRGRPSSTGADSL